MCLGERTTSNYRFKYGIPPFIIVSNNYDRLQLNQIPKTIMVANNE